MDHLDSVTRSSVHTCLVNPVTHDDFWSLVEVSYYEARNYLEYIRGGGRGSLTKTGHERGKEGELGHAIIALLHSPLSTTSTSTPSFLRASSLTPSTEGISPIR